MANNKQIAASVLEAVGGKENVSFVSHCMTRLRFTLKDRAVPDEAKIKNIDGVLGVQETGGQFQVIVGQNVAKVYDELCALGGFAKQAAIDEALDEPREGFSLKRLGSDLLSYLSGTMVAFIPVMLAAAMFKTLAVILGPGMLGLLAEDDGIYVLLNLLFNAGFYFMPIYLGYTAAKKLGATPVLGMFMGGILIEPSLVQMATEGAKLSVAGFDLPIFNYAQTVFPVLLSVGLMYWVEMFLKRHLPEAVSSVFTPFLTMLVSAPVGLFVLAPLGNELGNVVATIFMTLGNQGGIVGIAATTILAGIWQFVVMTGMHVVINTLASANMLQTGVDNLVFVAGLASGWATFGMAAGAFLRLKNKKAKSLAFGYLISAVVGGITEPTLYGIGFRYKRALLGIVAGGAAGALFASIMSVGIYVMPASASCINIVSFMGGNSMNFVYGALEVGIAFLVSTAVTYFFGFTKEDIQGDGAEEEVEAA